MLAKFQLTEKDLLSHVQQQLDVMRPQWMLSAADSAVDSKTVERTTEKVCAQLKHQARAKSPWRTFPAEIRELLTEEKSASCSGFTAADCARRAMSVPSCQSGGEGRTR